MLEMLRELYEEYLPELMQLATRRSRLNVRKLARQHKAETGQGLSPSQYRELASDLSQAALTDHWERYFQVCLELENANLTGNDLLVIEYCTNWLESSKLRFPRYRSLTGVGLSFSAPPAPYWVSDTDSDPQTLCDSLLPQAQRQLATALLSGDSGRSVCQRMFGGVGGRQWAQYRQLRLDLLQSLTFISELSRELRTLGGETNQSTPWKCYDSVSKHALALHFSVALRKNCIDTHARHHTMQCNTMKCN